MLDDLSREISSQLRPIQHYRRERIEMKKNILSRCLTVVRQSMKLEGNFSRLPSSQHYIFGLFGVSKKSMESGKRLDLTPGVLICRS